MKPTHTLLIVSLILVATFGARAQTNYEPYYFTTIPGVKIAEPRSVAADSAGNIYVAETSGGALGKISPDGTLSTVVAYKTAPNPWGVAVDGSDNVYVTHDSQVDKITPAGSVSTLATGLDHPIGVAATSNGTVFVGNTEGQARNIIRITPDGQTAVIASGFSVGPSGNPHGIAADGAGNVYATDTQVYSADDHAIIYKIDPSGAKTVLAGSSTLGNADGSGANATFSYPTEMACDKSGNVIVADFGNSTVRKITPSGFVTTLGGAPQVFDHADGVGGHAVFNYPYGAAPDQNGRIVVADSDNGLVRIGVPASRALNISTRMDVQSGSNVLIGGFIVSGSTPKKVLIRALGPSLSQAGINTALADPVLELHDGSGALIASDDNWKDKQQADIQATGVAPSNELEAAILATLNPGSYTAIVSGKNNGTGVGLVEVYDLDQNTSYRLANISTRGLVETGTNVMIGGFIIGGGPGNSDVLVRGIGPSLATTGVSNPLADPTVELHDVNGALIASNDNWKDTQQPAIQATGIPPSNDAESALVATLAPGNYTAVLAGTSGGTGVGLVEVYHLQ